MRSWLLRGVFFALLQTVIRIVQTMMINTWETQAILISVFLQVILAVVAVVWGYIDGRRDANAQPDPERRSDLAMTWLLAGLFAGFVSGLACWIIGKVYTALYVMGLFNEVTTFAAYTALLVFVFATIGVTIGRMLVDRRYNKEHPVRSRDRSGGGGDNPDTDVFEAVKDDDSTRAQPTR
jgi:MFS family permease